MNLFGEMSYFISTHSLRVMNEVPSNGKSSIFQCQKYSCQYQPNCNIHPRVKDILIHHMLFLQRSFTVGLIILHLALPNR